MLHSVDIKRSMVMWTTLPLQARLGKNGEKRDKKGEKKERETRRRKEQGEREKERKRERVRWFGEHLLHPTSSRPVVFSLFS